MSREFLFVLWAGGGNVPPQLTLARRMVERGHRVRMLTGSRFADIVEAWNDYLANHNDGRGFALIGHSQGSRMLRGLIRNHIDHRPSVRRRLVGALMLLSVLGT